jgi:hypothetical protein
MQGRRGCVGAESDFLQDQIILDLVEVQERHAARDDDTKMIVPLVQSSKNVEDEVAVEDGATEVGHALHLVTVVAHREVALDEVAERGIEVKHAHFTVADELVLDCVSNLTRGDAVLLYDVLKLIGYYTKDPWEECQRGCGR